MLTLNTHQKDSWSLLFTFIYILLGHLVSPSLEGSSRSVSTSQSGQCGVAVREPTTTY